jgi:solute carrier family 25 protein 34/35
MNGVRLGLYEPVQRALVRGTGADPSSVLLKAAAAAFSGALGATLGSPLYMIKSRLQAQRCGVPPCAPPAPLHPLRAPASLFSSPLHPSSPCSACRPTRARSPFFTVLESHHYSGLLDGLRKVHASEGFAGLFRGLNGALPRVMTGSAVQLSSYDTCKAYVVQWGVPAGVAQHLTASLLASVLTVTAMNPWDVISTRLYQSVGVNTQYSGPLDCAAQTVRREGWAALQKGWLAQYGRLGPHTVLTFLLLENVRPRVMGVEALVE